MLEDKVRLLEEIFGAHYRIHRKQGDEFLFFCPKCKHHKKKLSVNIDKNYFKCWVCDWASKSINWAIFQFGNQDQLRRWEALAGKIDFSNPNQCSFLNPDETPPRVKLPEEFMTLTNKNITPLSIPARQYLRERGINQHDINWWKMGYCVDGKYGKRIIIPSFDLTGYTNYFVGRTYIEYGPTYLNPTAPKDLIFNELYLDWNKDIILVEGVFDAIVAGNAIPLLGSTLRENSHLFDKIVSKCPRLYTALDPDASTKENYIVQSLLQYGVEVLKIPVKPFKDVGLMSKQEFQLRKQNAFPLLKDNEFANALNALKLTPMITSDRVKKQYDKR